MAIALLTQDEVAGTSLSPFHGQSGNMTRINAMITAINANTAALAGATDPFNFAGTIALAADFPTTAVVDSGDVYIVTADVLDNDATKTNTGLNFLAGSQITWDGTTWQDGDTDETGIELMAATPYTVAEGVKVVLVDTATIAGPSVVNLPVVGLARRGRSIMVIDASSGAAANPIAVTPQGADEIDNIAGPQTIDKNDGALAVFTEGAGYYTMPSAASLAVHEAVTASAHGKVVGAAAAIDMAPGGAPVNTPLALNGLVGNAFIPKELVLVCTAGAALAGDVTFSLGTSAGGAEISAAVATIGFDTAGQVFRMILVGVMPAILGNAALDITVTIADTGGGATGAMTAYIIGEEV